MSLLNPEWTANGRNCRQTLPAQTTKREFKQLRQQRQGQHQLISDCTFDLKISQEFRFIQFIYHWCPWYSDRQTCRLHGAQFFRRCYSRVLWIFSWKICSCFVCKAKENFQAVGMSMIFQYQRRQRNKELRRWLCFNTGFDKWQTTPTKQLKMNEGHMFEITHRRSPPKQEKGV